MSWSGKDEVLPPRPYPTKNEGKLDEFKVPQFLLRRIVAENYAHRMPQELNVRSGIRRKTAIHQRPFYLSGVDHAQALQRALEYFCVHCGQLTFAAAGCRRP